MEAVAAALRLPSYFDFDSLFRLDAVVAAKDHELFALLQIFLNDSLAQYKAWADSHAGVFAKYGACAYLALSTSHFFPRKGAIRLIRVSPELDNAQLERKIRLLTLATLGFQNMGRDVPYSSIASALQIEPAQVESWVIDGASPTLFPPPKPSYSLAHAFRTPPPPHSDSREPPHRQALPDRPNAARHPRVAARVRARAVGAPREAPPRVEGGPRERARDCRREPQEERRRERGRGRGCRHRDRCGRRRPRWY